MTGMHGGGLRGIIRRLAPENERGIVTFTSLHAQPNGPDELRFILEAPRTLVVDPAQRQAAAFLFGNDAVFSDVRAYEPIYQGTKQPTLHSEYLIKELGDCLFQMSDDALSRVGAIPAAYTYIGQFIAHDISNMLVVQGCAGHNLVSAALDLSSLFDGSTSPLLGPTCPGPGLNDLPRPDGGCPAIPDLRNDANLSTAQVQVMLARLHLHLCGGRNAVDPDAQQTTRNCFQYAVLHDYLPKIVGQHMANAVLVERKIVKPELYPDLFVVPLEFALAFFRFGHCMVRGSYSDWVNGATSVSPSDLWRRTHFGDSLPVEDSWVMPWDAMFQTNFARGFGPRLTRALSEIPVALIEQPQLPKLGTAGGQVVNLAAETMARGNRLGLATAQELGGQIAAVLADDSGWLIDLHDPTELQRSLGGGTPALQAFLDGAGRPFLDETPLWLYTLLEAQRFADGKHLGPMAGRVVAETIYAAIAADLNGILGANQDFDPARLGLVPRTPNAWFEAMAQLSRQPLPNLRGV